MFYVKIMLQLTDVKGWLTPVEEAMYLPNVPSYYGTTWMEMKAEHASVLRRWGAMILDQ